MLQEIVPGTIWVKRIPLRFYGIEMGTRMTVIRLADGGLFLHSPTRLDAETRAAIDALGPVRFVVAPNKLHHLFLADYVDTYAAARIYAAPGLPEKRPELAFHGVLGDRPESGWAGEIDQAVFRGSIYMDEIVFLHHEERTLIVADLLESFHEDSGPVVRLLARLAGVYRTPGLTRDQRLLVRNRKAARTSIERILSWDFERIILSHGRLIEHGGKEVFGRAFAWLFDNR